MPEAVLEHIRLADLPALKQPLAGGVYSGAITLADGRHVAVVWLDKLRPPQPQSHPKQMQWAADNEAQLPTRAIVSMMVANLGDMLPAEWVWTNEEYGSSFAWHCTLLDGYVGYGGRSAEGGAVAVRLIPLVL